MAITTKFSHPRCLPVERLAAPSFPSAGDEVYPNGVFCFHITGLLKWLNANPQPIISVPVRAFSEMHAVDDFIDKADVSQPIVLAEIAPDNRDFIPEIPEESWQVRGYVCIDGNHRLEKARNMGLETLPAVVLRMEQHLPFMYRGYAQYVEYWNGKLQDRVRDAQNRKSKIPLS